MANITPAAILTAAQTIIGIVDDIGVVVIDPKWTSFITPDLAPLARYLTSQNADDPQRAHGWLLAWQAISNQIDASGGTCNREITYDFDVVYLRPYSTDDGGVNSNVAFRETIFLVNEALNGGNANRQLGLGSAIFHDGLISTGGFTITDIPAPYGLHHFANFRFAVRSYATY